MYLPPCVQLSADLWFRQRKFQEKFVSKIKRLSLKSLSVKELKKKTKKLSFKFFIEKLSSDSDKYFLVLQFCIRLILKILWILFEIYLIWLGWVCEFWPASLCTFEPCCVYSEQRWPRGAVRPCLPLHKHILGK